MIFSTKSQFKGYYCPHVHTMRRIIKEELLIFKLYCSLSIVKLSSMWLLQLHTHVYFSFLKWRYLTWQLFFFLYLLIIFPFILLGLLDKYQVGVCVRFWQLNIRHFKSGVLNHTPRPINGEADKGRSSYTLTVWKKSGLSPLGDGGSNVHITGQMHLFRWP